MRGARCTPVRDVIEALLLAVTRATTFLAGAPLTHATGFFFERDGHLFLVTSRHVVLDETSDHRPDRLDIELHVDPGNVARTAPWSIPLYRDGRATWRQASDAAGTVDVVALEIARPALPPAVDMRVFTPAHLVAELEGVEVGTSVLLAGFPLGFHDTLHRLPVVRQAVIASSFGIRFQGNGYFLTDARLHRGMSGAPVVERMGTERAGRQALAWRLLGVHAARLDVGDRDREQDERLALNCAWYADVLVALTTDPAVPGSAQPAPPRG